MIRFLFKFVPYQYVGAMITVLIYLLHEKMGIDKKTIQQLVDSINQDLIGDDRYNRYVIENEELLNARVEMDVDAAINKYTADTTPVTITEYNYSEKESDGSLAQELLGGEMRLTAEFYQEDNEV